MDNEKYLFCWDEIPGKNEDQLKEFLKKDFCMDWLENAKIEKIEKERTIKVSNSKNHLSLLLNNEKTAVILKIDDCKSCEFIARSEGSRLNIYSINHYFNLIQIIQCKEQMLRDYLDNSGKKGTSSKKIGRQSCDPVKIKHLEKIIGHLQNILLFIDRPGNTPCGGTASLISLLHQVKDPENMEPTNAWELSDLFKIEVIRHGDDPYLFMLLKAQTKLDSPHKWDNHFPSEHLEMLLKRYTCGKFLDCYGRHEARRFLEHLEQAQIDEYRHDRAKTRLREKILVPMMISLAVLLALFSYFYYRIRPDDLNLLLLVLSSGALASILSRAMKLINQPLHKDAEIKTKELQPLGIRALMSESNIFIAQLLIGATSALMVFLVFSSGQIQLVVNEASKPAAYGIIGFLAGFSEVYFIGILDKVAGQTGGSLR